MLPRVCGALQIMSTADVPVTVDGRAIFDRDKLAGKLRAPRQPQAPLDIVKRSRSASPEASKMQGFIRRARRLAVTSALSGSDCEAMHATDADAPLFTLPSASVECETELRSLVGAMQKLSMPARQICVAFQIFERVHMACDTNCRCATFPQVSLRACASIANL